MSMYASVCVCVYALMQIACIPKPPLNKIRDREKQMVPVLLVTALRVIDGIYPA